MKNKTLLFVAHGSRQKKANDEVIELSNRFSNSELGELFSIETAFLEFAKPSLEEKLNEIALSGCNDILIFPYFVIKGKHLLTDIPATVKKIKEEFTDISISVTRHLGGMDGIVELIINNLKNSI